MPNWNQKFPYVDKPTSAGNHCVSCLASVDPRGFVSITSTYAQVPGYGTPALCTNCVYELGRVKDMLDPDQVARLHEQIDGQIHAIEQLHGKLASEKLDKVVPFGDIWAHFDSAYPLVAEIAEALKDGKLVMLDSERAKRRPEPTAKKSA